MKKVVAIILTGIMMVGCGEGFKVSTPPVPLNGMQSDGAVVRGIAVYTVQLQQESQFAKFLRNFQFINYAYAATGTSTVTYNNAASVSFSINVTNLGATGFTDDTLNLGSVALASLDDNHLKVCGVGGNQKCTKAAIRVYTTGATAGFVQTVDNYGAPLYVGTLNPTTAVGLNTAGSVQVQTYTIPNNKNRVRLSDFPSPTYTVTSDFSNAGDGPYSMTFVVEYVLLP